MPHCEKYRIAKTLQNYIEKKGAKLELRKTVNEKFAWYQSPTNKGFTLMDAETEEEEVFLLLRDSSWDVAKGIFESVEHVCELIYNWLEEEIGLYDLQDSYLGLEIFKPIKGSDSKYIEEWNRIKNIMFSIFELQKLEQGNWIARYNLMISQILMHEELKNYYPLRSHYRIILNKTRGDKTRYYISPIDNGMYLVSLRSENVKKVEKENPFYHGKFKSVKEAVDFYWKILSEKEIGEEYLTTWDKLRN